jgi:hypothetical protein
VLHLQGRAELVIEGLLRRIESLEHVAPSLARVCLGATRLTALACTTRH